ncbi:MAG: hypothetical protein IKM23_00540 [Bacteroidales bacterium]|nr:hypothetical protein [Bacteroidales bacterium]
MKKCVLLITMFFCLVVCLNAQSDGYFSYHDEYRYDRDSEWNELIMLPPVHGLEYNYPADDVPLCSGLLLMAGMSLIYMNNKKKKC